MTYQPDQDKCTRCTRADQDCSVLPFELMQRLAQKSADGEEVTIVKCEWFEQLREVANGCN